MLKHKAYSAMGTNDLDTTRLSLSHHRTSPSPYKVGIPPKQKLWKEFSSTLKETFFSDDPLRSFKDQSKSRKLILGIRAVFPILDWARGYDLAKFRGDLIAGLTIASLCIPQVTMYAYRAGPSNFEALEHAQELLQKVLQNGEVGGIYS
ncbi:Sulfate transporter 1.2 [Orobanche gracilis]